MASAKSKDNVRKRRLSEAWYRTLSGMLREAAKQEKYTTIVDIARRLAMIRCRRSEMMGLKRTEGDTEASCLRLENSKEGESIRSAMNGSVGMIKADSPGEEEGRAWIRDRIGLGDPG